MYLLFGSRQWHFDIRLAAVYCGNCIQGTPTVSCTQCSCPVPSALPPLAFLISKCFDRVCRSCSWRFGGELSEGWSTCWAKLRLVCQYNGAWSTLKVCASAVCQVKNGLYLCLRCFLVPPPITAWTFKSYLCPNPLCLFFGVSLYYFEVFKAKTFWRWKPATEGNNY